MFWQQDKSCSNNISSVQTYYFRNLPLGQNSQAAGVVSQISNWFDCNKV
jgi:hypothetical protein